MSRPDPEARVALVAAPGAACWRWARAWGLDPVALPLRFGAPRGLLGLQSRASLR